MNQEMLLNAFPFFFCLLYIFKSYTLIVACDSWLSKKNAKKRRKVIWLSPIFTPTQKSYFSWTLPSRWQCWICRHVVSERIWFTKTEKQACFNMTLMILIKKEWPHTSKLLSLLSVKRPPRLWVISMCDGAIMCWRQQGRPKTAPAWLYYVYPHFKSLCTW